MSLVLLLKGVATPFNIDARKFGFLCHLVLAGSFLHV